MATVWHARDRMLDRQVAIKLLAGPYARDEVAVRRFKREARAAARLSGHPSVVTIYDVGQTRPSDEAPLGRPFMVMELMPGGTVAEALRRGGVQIAEALAWLGQAAAALDYAHGHGVIHRDVKLSNLLLDSDGVLHVADFGIARLGAEETLTGTGQLLGTAAYLAPELALGQPATEASDRYALAVAAYELLVGERPFAAEHFAAMARQHVEEPPPVASFRNRSLPRAVDAVLERGMAKRPEQRPATATAFVDDLEHALRGRRAPAPAAVPAWRAPRIGPRHAAALGACAAAALAVGIAVGATQGPATRSAHRLARVQAPPAARRVHLPARPAPKPATTQSAPAPTTHSAPAPTPPPGADALEARGHGLMESGDYQSAIQVLHKALSAASPGSLTYAYALYDLGRSLRLAGDPQAAIPILYRRLAIPDQTDVVRTELQLALRAAGRSGPTTGGAAAPAPKPKHGHGHAADGLPPGQPGASQSD